MFTSLNLLQAFKLCTSLSCRHCTKLKVQVLGCVGCWKWHVSSAIVGIVSKPLLLYRDFTALCSPGQLLRPDLPVDLHSPAGI